MARLNDTTYRVYHDGRVNSPILYDNVVMLFDFDYCDDRVSDIDTGLAIENRNFKIANGG